MKTPDIGKWSFVSKQVFHKPSVARDDVEQASVASYPGPASQEHDFSQKFNIIKRMFYEINCNRNLTSIVVEWRRYLFLVSLLAAEIQWIIDTLSAFLSRHPITTEVPSLSVNHQMVQERTFMSTTQPSLGDQRLEPKLFSWSEQMYDDC